MFLTGESRLEWDYSIERAELDGIKWKKSLKTLQGRLTLCGRLSTIGVFIVPILVGWITLLIRPGLWVVESRATLTVLCYLAAVTLGLAFIAGSDVLIGRHLKRKIAKHREKTMALWVVQFGSVPDYALLLWQFFGQPELSWNFVPSEEAYGWLSRYLGDGYILLAKGESKPLSVLAFLKEWKNSPAAAKIAEALDEDLAPVPEECRQTLYWTEFWQRFKEEG